MAVLEAEREKEERRQEAIAALPNGKEEMDENVNNGNENENVNNGNENGNNGNANVRSTDSQTVVSTAITATTVCFYNPS